MVRGQFKEIFTQKLGEFFVTEDPMLAMLEWLMKELMELEAEQKVGAEKYGHNPERKTYFSGHRPRRFDTRFGSMYLMIPKVRNGGYIPFFLQEKKRTEMALMEVIREAYINGVSTRKIDKLAKAMGIQGLSSGQVSELVKGLDDQVAQWRSRPLESEYPVLWADAVYEKIREGGRVISSAVLVVQGLTKDGAREILAVEPMVEESEETYLSVFRSLKARGVKKVWLVVSDAHAGLKKAAQKAFLKSSWQRCKVHFMRNILAHVPHQGKKSFAEDLKQIWLQKTRHEAWEEAKTIITLYQDKYPKAIETLENGLEDSLQFYTFHYLDSRKISSTNILERLNREIRRRSRVVGIFPNFKSYIRLITAFLLEYTEDWFSNRNYISPDAIAKCQDIYENIEIKAA